ncbi:hypothetical protein CSC71_04445 [Pseudoxanthomonas sangjuensis]|nr:hypothetical protein CSC71_04445 [Pseudoxanthomonas sangjuensis]
MRFRGNKWFLALVLGILLQPAWVQAQTAPETDAVAQPMACIDCGDPDEDDAAFVDQSVPASLQTGQTATVTIRMQNTGNTTWRSSSGYNLVPVSPQIGTTWGVSQIASGTIYANQTATFSFSITAPATAGTYNFQWQMSHSGSWFGVPTVNVAILVTAPVSPPPELPPSPNYSRTETITYHDNTAKWVLGQTASVTCTAAVPTSTACNGDVVSSATYDTTYALPLTQSAFGKLQQTLTYDTASAVSTGQRGTLKTVKDGNNNVTTLTNWKRGIPQTIKYPITPESPTGATESAVVNDNGWITSVTDENGYKTCYGYDVMGRISQVTYPSEATAGACDTSTWAATTQVFEPVASTEYGIAAGHWRQTVSTGNGKKISYFDALWRPQVVREYDAGNVAGTQRFQRFTYDHEGRTTFAAYPGTTDALSTGTWTEYDALGRVTSVSQDSEQGLLTATTAYLSGFQTLVINPRGAQTVTAYQAYDQPGADWPVAIAHPQGAYTHITRDPFGKPTRIRRSNSSSPTGGTVALNRDYAYNANQELCRAVEPETGATLMGYDGAGNLKWSAAGLGSTQACETAGTSANVAPRRVDRTYDARNRLKTLVFPDGLGNQSWTYTPDGLPASVTAYNAAGNTVPVVTNYSYNKRRLLTRETLVYSDGGVNWPYNYAYNANGHLANNNWHGLTIDYAPNALGQPTKVGSYASGVSYYPNGAVKQFTYGNGIVHTMTQNARQLPARSLDCIVAGCTAAADKRLDLSYSFDKNANVSQIVDGIDGRQTRGMSYDGLDRLTQTTSNMFGTAGYSYDVLDNLTQVNVGGGSKARNHYYCYDTNWRLGNVKTGSCAGATVIGLGYDVQGNLANKNGTLYSFDYGNRLRSVGGTANAYVYDGLGRRVSDAVNGVAKRSQYTQGGQLVMVGDNRAGKVTEYFYLAGSLVAWRERNTTTNVYTTRYQHTDALGTPIAETDANKAFMNKYEYEPYGQQINGTAKDGPGYTGHVQDAATGMTYMQQRYMDPVLGVFLSVDPVTAYSNPVGAFNRYLYASNNPYAFIDPDGRQSQRQDEYEERQRKNFCGVGGCNEGTSYRSATSGLFRRYKTPKSQRKLIESVGGDTELLEMAQESHENFVTTLITIVAGGGIAGAGRGGTTTLYRAVSEAEAASIRATGRFSIGPNSLEGKWLAESLKHAKEWGDKLNGKGISKLLEIKLPKSIADKLFRVEKLDGVGPARYAELSQLEQAAIRELP